MPETSECPVCGSSKPHNRRLCRDCHLTYGGSSADWPAWLRLIINDIDREEYDDEQASEHEVPSGDVELHEDMDSDLDEPLWTRPKSEMALVEEALPYAPYDDEDMNRAYRKANGIPERKKS
jgi:hypothetical protein